MLDIKWARAAFGIPSPCTTWIPGFSPCQLKNVLDGCLLQYIERDIEKKENALLFSRLR